MKKAIAIIFILTLAFTVRAQKTAKNSESKYFTPHSFGTKMIDVKYMKTADGLGMESTYSIVNKNSTLSNVTIGWDKGEIGNGGTKYNNLSLNYMMLHSIYNVKRKLYFNVGAGAYTALEKQKNDILNKKNSSFGLGVLATLECEYYINRIAIVIAGDQIYKPVSNIGNLQWRAKIGLRYIF